MSRCLVLAVLIAAILGCPRPADAQEDRYVQIYGLIQEGDALMGLNQTAAALAKYREAQGALEHFRNTYPEWNANIVNFRLTYIADKIALIAPNTPAPPAPVVRAAPAPITPAPSPASAPAQSPPKAPVIAAPKPAPPPATNPDVDSLRNQVQRLQSDNSDLQAKLREAFAARPASIDPRELANAREQIRELQKENALLQAGLAQRPVAPSAAPADARAVDQLKHDLADANAKLSQQQQQTESLTRDRKALQARVDSLISASWNATNLDASRKALAEANRKLAEQTNAVAKLNREKDDLQSRVNLLATENESLISLRAENELLKKLAGRSPPVSGPDGGSSRELTEARAQIAALQSDREIWRLEKIALENRVRQLSSPSTTVSAIPPYNPAEESAQVKRLEHERDDLQKKLDAAQKELYGRNRKSAAARIDELNNQLTTLRARLGVVEAQAVPYTAEELALFSKPEPTVVAGAGKKPLQSLSANEAVLVAEAQRDFSANRFDAAEEKYQEVLRHDDRNVNALTDLATIEMRQGHFGESEQHLKQALVLDPQNVYSLSRLGLLKFQQDKVDEALDVLSRAVKIDPKDPEIENFLGLTLSRKGLRGPAETALRKAIQLDPNYGDAHNNLAVIYATQKPPLLELARWHYDKALGAGHAHNPELEKLLEPKAAEGQ